MATKADVRALETRLIKWGVGIALATVGLVLAGGGWLLQIQA